MAKVPVHVTPAAKVEAPVPEYKPTLQEILAAAYEEYAMTPDHKRTVRIVQETGIGGVVYTVVFPE
jgi:hypothetical protein